MAFKMRSPLHYGKDDKKGYGGSLQKADITGNMADLSGDKTTEKDDVVVDSNTGEEETIDGNNTPEADKLIEKAKEEDEGQSLEEYNPAMYARRKKRKSNRERRQQNRAERIEERAENPMKKARRAIRETIKADRADARDERRVTRAAEKLTKFDPNMSKDMIDDVISTPGMMQPNRAGRPVNSNMLMTSPQLMHGKHSVRDAVAQLRMRKIAQSE